MKDVFTVLFVVGCCACSSNSTTAPTTSSTTTTGLPPVITSITPASGTPDGGTSVTIAGTGFTGASSVVFGTLSAVFTAASDSVIVATAPAAAAATVSDITVTTPLGTSATTAADQYSWGTNGLTALTLSATSVSGGTPVIATVSFALPVVSAVSLPVSWTSDPAGTTAVLLPTSVTIPAGAQSATFQITTFFTSSPQQLTVSTSYAGVTASASLTVTD